GLEYSFAAVHTSLHCTHFASPSLSQAVTARARCPSNHARLSSTPAVTFGSHAQKALLRLTETCTSLCLPISSASASSSTPLDGSTGEAFRSISSWIRS